MTVMDVPVSLSNTVESPFISYAETTSFIDKIIDEEEAKLDATDPPITREDLRRLPSDPAPPDPEPRLILGPWPEETGPPTDDPDDTEPASQRPAA